MENRKVKISLTLIGKTKSAIDIFKDLSNEDTLNMIVGQVTDQFGKRPIYIHDKKTILAGIRYPGFYAAGWFVSDHPVTNTDGNISELVVIAHGESMEKAINLMMKTVPTLDWDELAKNV